MVQNDIGPEPERYYDWMIWKLRQSKKLQEMRKYSKEKKIEEKHKHSNAVMLDLKELTKCHYDLLKKYQKLYDENQSLKEGMNCWSCGTKLIWGGDHDLEEDAEIDSEHTIVTNLSCNNCNAYVEVYHS